jgi:hypothetical protein
LKRPKRAFVEEFTEAFVEGVRGAEFRELAVKRIKGGRDTVAVSRERGISSRILNNEVKAFKAGKLNGEEKPMQ